MSTLYILLFDASVSLLHTHTHTQTHTHMHTQTHTTITYYNESRIFKAWTRNYRVEVKPHRNKAMNPGKHKNIKAAVFI